LKRALRNFGNVLGNCLYDKVYLAKVKAVKSTPAKFDPDQLHRHASLRPTDKEGATGNQSEDDKELKSKAETTEASEAIADYGDDYMFDGLEINPDEVLVLDGPQQAIKTGQMNEVDEQQSANYDRNPHPAPVALPQHSINPVSDLQAQQQQSVRNPPQPGSSVNGPGRTVANGNRNSSAHIDQNQPRQQSPALPLNDSPQKPQPTKPSTVRVQTYSNTSNQAKPFSANPPPQSNGEHPKSNTMPLLQSNGQQQPPHTIMPVENVQQSAKSEAPNSADLGTDIKPQFPMGFYHAKASEVIDTENGVPIVSALVPFDTHAPITARSPHVSHNVSRPVRRQVVGQTLPNGSNRAGSPTPNRPTNFVNPQADPNRRVGVPMNRAPSPLSNKTTYKPPGMSGVKRPADGPARSPLSDVSNVQNQTGADAGLKKVKLDPPTAVITAQNVPSDIESKVNR